MRNLLDVAVVVGVALLVSSFPGAAADDDDGKRKAWVAQYQDLQVRHARLQRELEQVRSDYSRGCSTKRLSGEGKTGVIKEIARLEDELAKADQELRDFPDTARRAGAFPGWFRDLEEPAPAAAQSDRSRSSENQRDRRASERKRRRLGRD